MPSAWPGAWPTPRCSWSTFLIESPRQGPAVECLRRDQGPGVGRHGDRPRPRFPEAADLEPRPRSQPRRPGPGPQPAGEVRRAVLSGDRRARAPGRPGGLVRPMASGATATSGRTSMCSTTPSDRSPIGWTRRVRLSRNPRFDDGPRMEMCLQKGPARSGAIPAGRVDFDRTGRARPASFRAGGVAEPGLARLAAAAAGAPAGLRRGTRLRHPARGPRRAEAPLRPDDRPVGDLLPGRAAAHRPRPRPDRRAGAGRPGCQARPASWPRDCSTPLRTGEEREREQRLDEATDWLRRHHPEAAEIWRGREVRDRRWCGAAYHRAWDRADTRLLVRPANDPVLIAR